MRRREGKGKEEDEREVVGVYQWFDVLKQSSRPHLILDSLLWIYLRRGQWRGEEGTSVEQLGMSEKGVTAARIHEVKPPSLCR